MLTAIDKEPPVGEMDLDLCLNWQQSVAINRQGHRRTGVQHGIFKLGITNVRSYPERRKIAQTWYVRAAEASHFRCVKRKEASHGTTREEQETQRRIKEETEQNKTADHQSSKSSISSMSSNVIKVRAK